MDIVRPAGLKLTGGVALIHPKVQWQEADDGFGHQPFAWGYRIGLTYDQYLGREQKFGFRTGLNLVNNGTARSLK